MQNDADELDRAWLQALAFQGGIECGQVLRAKFLKQLVAKMLTHMRQRDLVPLPTVEGDVGSNPITLEPLDEGGNGDLGRRDRAAVLLGRDQASAFVLRLPLRAGERVPAAFPFAALLHVDHDGPMAG